MPRLSQIGGDTETGGLYPSIHALLSVSLTANWCPDLTLTVYLLPLPGKEVEPQAAQKNGYSPEVWTARGAVPADVGMARIIEWLQARFAEQPTARLVAHQSGFDKGFIEETGRLTGHSLPHRHNWRCSASTFGLLMDLGIIPEGSASLARLGELAGLWPVDGRPEVHEADEDAVACLHGQEWSLQQLRDSMRLPIGSSERLLSSLATDLGLAQTALGKLLPHLLESSVRAFVKPPAVREAIALALKALGTTEQAVWQAHHGIVSAYRDEGGWVLFDANRNPVEWPPHWPQFFAASFLQSRGITIA